MSFTNQSQYFYQNNSTNQSNTNTSGAGPADTSINQIIGGLSRSSLNSAVPLNRTGDNVIYIDRILQNGNYLVRWISTNQLEELQPSDVSDHAKMVHREVSNHNQMISQQGNINPNKKAIIYTRISNANETPINTQLYYCSDYARRNGLQLQPFGYLVDNGISGRNGNNLAKGELSIFEKYIDSDTVIIINSIDRLCRHTSSGINFLENMSNKGVFIYFVTEQILWHKDMDVILKRRVRDSLSTAEEFSDIISEKIKRNLQMRKAQGHHIGRTGFGFKTQRINNIMKKVKVNSEIEIIKLIVTWVNDNINQYGSPNYYSVISNLNNNNYFNRKGKPFTYAAVSSMYRKYKTDVHNL